MDYRTAVENEIVRLSQELELLVLMDMSDPGHMITICDENDNGRLVWNGRSIVGAMKFLKDLANPPDGVFVTDDQIEKAMEWIGSPSDGESGAAMNVLDELGIDWRARQ